MKPSITSTDTVWEWFSKNQPYFGVLLEAKYRNEQLTEEAKKDFFLTGKAHVDFILQTLKEHFDTDFTIKEHWTSGAEWDDSPFLSRQHVSKSLGLMHRQVCFRRQQRMKEAGAESIEFLLGDDNLSTLGSEGFDFINSFIIFQHIPLNRGYHLLRRLLSLLNEGGIAVLHFTYNTPTPDCAFTLKSRHGFAWYLRYRSYVVNGIMKLVEGNSFDKPLPVMQMNEYNLSSIHKLLYENECGEVYTRFTDHAGALGVLLFCRKVNRAAVIWCLSIFVAVSSDQQIERGGPIMDGLNDAFTNIRSMMQLVVHSWVTCRFVTFLGIDELRLMPVNQVENHSGLLKIGGLSAS